MIRFLRKLFSLHKESCDSTDGVASSVHVHNWVTVNNPLPTTFEEAMEDAYGRQICSCGAERWTAFEQDDNNHS